jgi:malonate-semialdehyde dehydrogenase (acetylating)/methylmalonate-semialdehyde dehydrogenase
MSNKELAPSLNWPDTPFKATNLIAGKWVDGSAEQITINSPYNNKALGTLHPATSSQIDAAISAAEQAFQQWRAVPIKERAALLLSLRSLLLRDIDRLSRAAALESGKTFTEGKAEVLKGIEVLEFATSLQNSDSGGALEVSRGVTCEYRREPLGVTAGITPFNFPAMVPMWMIPISLAVGNAFILKPSDKVPFTPCILGELIIEAGFPAGVFSIIQGGRLSVEQLATNPAVTALGFVGSSPVAQSVYTQATARGKRALCLGGAKNHLIITPDADPQLTIDGVVASFTGCAGQRCMAASVLVAIGDTDRIIDGVVKAAQQLQLGRDMGALIDRAAYARLTSAIERATKDGATLKLDGRLAKPPTGCEDGNWLGPTIIDNVTTSMDCSCTELFGPVLSIVRVKTIDEALQLERNSIYGNALSVFTTSGHVARYVSDRATSGMIGINVGVPVPREPFSFGGTKSSKFGSGDITGWGGVEHWSNRKKITTKWAPQSDKNWMS